MELTAILILVFIAAAAYSIIGNIERRDRIERRNELNWQAWERRSRR